MNLKCLMRHMHWLQSIQIENGVDFTQVVGRWIYPSTFEVRCTSSLCVFKYIEKDTTGTSWHLSGFAWNLISTNNQSAISISVGLINEMKIGKLKQVFTGGKKAPANTRAANVIQHNLYPITTMI